MAGPGYARAIPCPGARHGMRSTSPQFVTPSRCLLPKLGGVGVSNLSAEPRHQTYYSAQPRSPSPIQDTFDGYNHGTRSTITFSMMAVTDLVHALSRLKLARCMVIARSAVYRLAKAAAPADAARDGPNLPYTAAASVPAGHPAPPPGRRRVAAWPRTSPASASQALRALPTRSRSTCCPASPAWSDPMAAARATWLRRCAGPWARPTPARSAATPWTA